MPAAWPAPLAGTPVVAVLEQAIARQRLARRKVAVVFEADRLNAATSNKFLKTLEEPPAGTFLLLVTTRPNDLLPTIRSRCQRFQFKVGAGALDRPDWRAWLDAYRDWLARLTGGASGKTGAADLVLALYGLVARFNTALAAATPEKLAAQKDALPPDLDEDEAVALETGLANGLRQKLFTGIERATRDFALTRLDPAAAGSASNRAAARALVAAVETLEQSVRLLRLNLNESAALEEFLLASLRIWTPR